MGFDFDDSGKNDEYGADENEVTGEVGEKPKPPRPTVQPSTGAAVLGNAEQIVARMLGHGSVNDKPTTAEQAVAVAADAYMDEVDERFEVASYYRQLLKGGFFTNPSKAGSIVEYEVMGFVRERLGVLLSIGNVPKARHSEFSEVEVSVLRRLATLDDTQLAAFQLLLEKLSTANAMVQAPPPRPSPQRAPARPSPTPTLVRHESPESIEDAAPPPQPVRRGPGRPPGSKTKPRTVQEVPAVDPETGQPILNANGEQVILHKVRRNVAPGGIPFPTSKTEMEAATMIAASKHKTVDQHGQQVDGLVTLARNL